MPDLESQIDAWREETLATGMSSDAVAELESHLRDDVARQIKSGAGESDVFENAVRDLGQSADLRKEFKKVRSFRRLAARTRDTMLSFAGIPNHYVYMNAPSPNLDSRWATYLRSALFLLPAVCLWMLAATFVIPQFHALWDKAVWDKANIENAADFTKYLRFDLAVMYVFKDHFFYIICFTLLALGLLEWRFHAWPRYRRAVFGAVVFLVNVAVLLSFAIVFVGATLVATQFSVHAG
jgi:hypothetical protein